MSMLVQSDVVGYLLERGLLDSEAVVDGELVVRDTSSRNCNFQIECKGTSYLLKQGWGPEGSATVAHEAGIYHDLTSGDSRLRHLVPRFYGYDTERRILILELIRDAQNLRDYHLQRGHFSTTLAAAAGDGLGALHRLTWRDGEIASGHAPWVLSVHRPDLGIFRDSSAASIEVIKIVQHASDFGRCLDELRAGWRIQALIHQDVKWDNLIAYASGRSGRMTRVKIVDWEASMWGDPCWDIGSLFSHYLSFWLFSIPITGPTPPERFPELARHPISKMQPALRKCWKGYVAQLALDPSATRHWLVRTVQFAAARLVQTAFEAAQMLEQLNSNLILHLQLSLNMLQRPREAAVHLLGFPLQP